MPVIPGPISDEGNITLIGFEGAVIPITEEDLDGNPIDISDRQYDFYVRNRLEFILPEDPSNSLGKILLFDEDDARKFGKKGIPFYLRDVSDPETPIVLWAGKICRLQDINDSGSSTSDPLVIQREFSTLLIQRTGIPGPPGPGGGGGSVFQHNQGSSAAEWIVNHNLAGKPSGVNIIDTGGREVEADVLHISDNQLRIYFTTPQTGIVRVSP